MPIPKSKIKRKGKVTKRAKYKLAQVPYVFVDGKAYEMSAKKKRQVLKLLKAKIRAAQRSLYDEIQEIYFSDGTNRIKGGGMEPSDGKVSQDGFTLDSGKCFYANCRILGINPRGVISEGYDGGIRSSNFTLQERREIADYMMALWDRFGNGYDPKDE